ncbi:spartin-like [Epinephelus moara]|uniref:spartin-like n=1 Tax=Epinephelus moara TaxID=300413 RepID=UPI00214F2F42|nr:spartin-like [Epinephelus moara]
MRFSRDGLGCINKGLAADEAGEKAQALELYKRGWQHLLRAISVSSQGEECVSSSWGSARQMQHKMQRTLNNITTHLAILETSSDLGSAPTLNTSSVSGSNATDISKEGLYPKLPTINKPERPARPHLLSANGQAGAVGAGQPPAYSPQAVDGHLSISYGTDAGKMSLVGKEFYILRNQR